MRSLGCLLLAVTLSPAADPIADMKAFQGDWRLTTIEADGKRDEPDGLKIAFKGDKILVNGEEKFTFKIDPACNPKIIDVTEIDDKDKTVEGIYRFDGKKLTICLYGPSKVRMRPVKFGEEESAVVTLERAGE
jgi:uncharacterized protein (TIGR03067 family)